jgi:HSP20 family molecular chaperone IbpA
VPAAKETKAEPEKSSEGAGREAPRPPGASMNHEPDQDPGEAPDTEQRKPDQRKPVPSLPAPRTVANPPALRAPSPTVEPSAARTPVAEVTISPSHVYVTVELPGAPKDALEIRATDRTLTVDAKRLEGPPYRLDLALPVPINPESAKATYRNGILDVTLARADRTEGDANGA